MRLSKTLFALSCIPLLMVGACKKDEADTGVIPTVQSSAPLNDATDVPISTSVAFTFSQSMNSMTLNTSTVSLYEGTTQVAGSVVSANTKATFTTTNLLKLGTVYKAFVSAGVESATGGELKNDYSITFTTTSTADELAPFINSTIPLTDATGVPRNKTISVVFNEPMNAATINESTFTLKQGTTDVSGTVAYANNTATFTSNSIFESNTTYTTEITTAATDAAGNALTSGKQWSFKTSNSSETLALVNLGGGSNYVILAKTAINNSSTSALVGNLGLSPAATSYITGLALVNATGHATSAQVTGNVYAADMAAPTPLILTNAVNDMITAYNDAAGRPTPDFLELATGNIGGKTLTAGLYKWTSTVTIPTDVALTGSATDVWIFQIDGDLTQSSATNITLSGGAVANHVFWQVAGEATIGANAHFEGNLLSMTGVTLLTGASMTGRALAQTAVILDANAVTKPQ